MRDKDNERRDSKCFKSKERNRRRERIRRETVKKIGSSIINHLLMTIVLSISMRDKDNRREVEYFKSKERKRKRGRIKRKKNKC